MAKHEPAIFDQTKARQYTLQDGLAGMLIEDIYQDRRGLLWIATADGGVSRFDVYHWAWKFAQDASGHLWIASRHRNEEAVVGRYDPRGQVLDMIDVDAPPGVAEIVRPGIRHIRRDDRGWLW